MGNCKFSDEKVDDMPIIYDRELTDKEAKEQLEFIKMYNPEYYKLLETKAKEINNGKSNNKENSSNNS